MASASSSSSFRSQFRQAVVATESGNASRFEIDVGAWLKRADVEFTRANGTMTPFLEAEAVGLSKRVILDEYIRSTRSPYVDQYRQLQKIASAATRKSRLETIRLGPGQIVSKREVDCTITERIILAQQYERSGAGDLRRARYHRAVAELLTQAGMSQQQSLHDWMDRQAAGGTP